MDTIANPTTTANEAIPETFRDVIRIDHGQAKTHLEEAMQLARHSDPKLTMAVYGRAQLHDLGAAVRRPPAVSVGSMGSLREHTC